MRSAIITTYQSEKTISYALNSIAGFIDNVCIVDGRWKKNKQQISTSISSEKIDDDIAYIKLVETIENILPSCSTDQTISICNKYKSKFKDFNIICNEVKRVSELDARGQSLRHILNLPDKSDWIYIVDSDEIWTEQLKSEIFDIEQKLGEDLPYRIKMKAKVFVELKKFYNSIYTRGFKNCGNLCNFFSSCNSIPYYTCEQKTRENSKSPSKEFEVLTCSYFLHYSIPDINSHLMKSLCYGSYGIKSFINNIINERNENNQYFNEYFGSSRKIEGESLELFDYINSLKEKGLI
jgi:glycosyltransferase involved in cell wall biosynthesis